MMSSGLSYVDTLCYCGTRYRLQARANSRYGKQKLYYRQCPVCHRPINPVREKDVCVGCRVPRRFFKPYMFSRKRSMCKNCANVIRAAKKGK